MDCSHGNEAVYFKRETSCSLLSRVGSSYEGFIRVVGTDKIYGDALEIQGDYWIMKVFDAVKTFGTTGNE